MFKYYELFNYIVNSILRFQFLVIQKIFLRFNNKFYHSWYLYEMLTKFEIKTLIIKKVVK